jgi:hypothetical protein
MIMPDTTYPFDLSKFDTYIKSLYTNGYVESWWHYLPGGLYLIGTHLEVNQIYNLLIKHMPNRSFIVMEVNPKNQQGWLTKEAWNWFRSYKL